ncbi:MAG TPA: tetratricopeptide repeat protein [Puia sp.]|jgi:tetratricopeptide (TPR) repeat protein|nr:tetratricopeptide repeat protein [Puia sp.]
MNSLEYIEDYFKGLLTATQKEEFEQRVLSDPSFAEELAFYLNTQALLRDELTAEKKARFKELYRQNEPLLIQQRPVRRLWPYLVAASALVIIIAGWLIFGSQPGPEKLADQYISGQLQNLPVKMSSVQDSLQKAIALYNQGQLPEALTRFQQLLQQDSARPQAKIYSGIVCLRLQQYDKALDYFQQLEADTALYSNPALFYQSLTLMKRNHPGDSQKARQLLQLVVDRDLDKKEDAQQLLLKHW